LIRNVVFWVLAVILTIVSVIWQRTSGPTYPFTVDLMVDTVAVTGELNRSWSINSDMPVEVQVAEPGTPDPGVEGVAVWRRFPTQDEWTRLPLVYNQETGLLRGELPRQPMAGKLEYHVELSRGGQVESVPGDEAAVSRFKGDVPQAVLVVHIFLMFFGMLWSTRAGLEALAGGPGLRTLAKVTFFLLLIGGMMLGPIVQKYAFDAFWTGWPLGEDLTDNKLGLAVLLWAIAAFRARKATAQKPVGRWWAIAAMIIVIVIFSIPHSMHGSTYDYATGEHIQALVGVWHSNLG